MVAAVLLRGGLMQERTKLQFYPTQNAFRSQVSEPRVIRCGRCNRLKPVIKFHPAINSEQAAGVHPSPASNRAVTLRDRAQAAESLRPVGLAPGPGSVRPERTRGLPDQQTVTGQLHRGTLPGSCSDQ